MYDDGVYFNIIIFNLPFNRTVSSDLDHSSITLKPPIIDGFEQSYEVIGIVGHSGGGTIVHSKEEVIQV